MMEFQPVGHPVYDMWIALNGRMKVLEPTFTRRIFRGSRSTFGSVAIDSRWQSICTDGNGVFYIAGNVNGSTTGASAIHVVQNIDNTMTITTKTFDNFGHCNSITYKDGHLYIVPSYGYPTSETTSLDVASHVVFDITIGDLTSEWTYEVIHLEDFEELKTVVAIDYYKKNGYFYIHSGNGIWKTSDFSTFTEVFVGQIKSKVYEYFNCDLEYFDTYFISNDIFVYEDVIYKVYGHKTLKTDGSGSVEYSEIVLGAWHVSTGEWFGVKRIPMLPTGEPESICAGDGYWFAIADGAISSIYKIGLREMSVDDKITEAVKIEITDSPEPMNKLQDNANDFGWYVNSIRTMNATSTEATAGLPTGTNLFLIGWKRNSSYGKQIAVSYSDNIIYSRNYFRGAWDNFQPINQTEILIKKIQSMEEDIKELKTLLSLKN